jgi:hypothetical protein
MRSKKRSMIYKEVRKNQAVFISSLKAIISRISRTMGSRMARVNKIVINSTERINNRNNFIISIKIFSKTLNIIKNSKDKSKSKLSTMILFFRI